MDTLARLHQAARQPARAESLLQRSLEIKKAKLGKHHPAVARTLYHLAALYAHYVFVRSVKAWEKMRA